MLVLVPEQVNDCRDLLGLEELFMIGICEHPNKFTTISILEHPVQIEKFDIDGLHRGLGVHQVRISKLLLLKLGMDLQGKFNLELVVDILLFDSLLFLVHVVLVWWASKLFNLSLREDLG